MTDFGTEMLAVVEELLDPSEFGIEWTFTEPADVPDAVESTVSGTPVVHAILGSPPLDERLVFRDPDLAVAGQSRICLKTQDLAGLDYTPELGDELLLNGETWRVRVVDSLKPDERVAAWFLGVAR